MPQNALIVFLKYPELGHAKTRLAKNIGDEKALKVYLELLKHTNLITDKLSCDKFLYYDKSPGKTLDWGAGYATAFQKPGDLGERMKQAFADVFALGYNKVIIIGSDCYELNTEIIEQVFIDLDDKEAVVGPAKDGGYYLLGLKSQQDCLFENIAWSTENVFQQSLAQLEEGQISYGIAPTLSDIDTLEDLPEALKQLINY
ncbi:hypothetical protein BCY91_07310 [Pelobium manganitolerans]|uniref:Glycosyltransferase n=1 Tax=Pelobium manganitolerans TaxID=1842495 RepID=A0A419S3R7_9SPHI|nr:TIGR04282 family arsenosugar biosynthesis glycosyltransferase [Pelobium manganitolerans]RKD14289.1 hypothetical protein BCY91_07310 [Pelobium manganitolerans]